MQLFKQGVPLPFQKGKTLERGVEELAVTQVRLPISSGAENAPVPSLPATAVTTGEELCRNDGTPVVASITGAIEGTVLIDHPLYGPLRCVDIPAAEEQGEEQRLPVPAEEALTPDTIPRIAQEAAIFDELDGIPLWEKLEQWCLPANDPAALHSILVADATENDVFGSAAWSVVMDQPKLVLFGLQMAAKAIRFSRYHIATMLPKQRRRTLKRAVGRVNVFTVDDEYPVTAYANPDLEVYRIGVQACLALGRALKQGLRHTAAIVTVAGDALPAPRNLRVPFGTPISAMLAACQVENRHQVLLGDAMVGLHCADPSMPLLPGITTVLAMHPKRPQAPGPCIGCGRCAEVCHADLLPYEIVRLSENMHYERLQQLSAQECDGCAACSYVCPAHRDVAADVLRAGQSEGTLFLTWEEDDHE